MDSKHGFVLGSSSNRPLLRKSRGRAVITILRPFPLYIYALVILRLNSFETIPFINPWLVLKSSNT